MTTPVERMRSLRWAGELLALLACDAVVPPSIRSSARTLQSEFPRPTAIEQHLVRRATALPSDWVISLLRAQTLFEVIAQTDRGDQSTRSKLRLTMRHYPDRQTITLMGSWAALADWLQPEQPASSD